MRQVDADVLIEQIKNPYTEYPVMIKIRKAIEDMINEAPTVSQHVESVGEDGSALKHGHWIDENGKPVSWDDMNIGCPSDSCFCSKCGDWLTASDEYPAKGYYCPNCGAKMDEEVEKVAVWEEPENNPWFNPWLNPCRGCDDYDGQGGCKSNGGCGAKMDEVTE